LELRGRLRAGTQVIASPAPVDASPEPAPAVVERLPVAGLGLRECWLIRWRGASLDADDAQALGRRLGLVAVRHDVAGGSDFEPDLALIESMGPAERAVVLVVEGWEAPDKATRHFVQALRLRGAPERPIFVAVLIAAADAPELALWRDRMRLLEDPFVSVQALVASGERAQQELVT
jgi:hypothetical protein